MILHLLIHSSLLLLLSSGPFFEFFPRPFKEWSRVSYKEDSPDVYLFDEIPAAKLDFEKFSRSSEILSGVSAWCNG